MAGKKGIVLAISAIACIGGAPVYGEGGLRRTGASEGNDNKRGISNGFVPDLSDAKGLGEIVGKGLSDVADLVIPKGNNPVVPNVEGLNVPDMKNLVKGVQGVRDIVEGIPGVKEATALVPTTAAADEATDQKLLDPTEALLTLLGRLGFGKTTININGDDILGELLKINQNPLERMFRPGSVLKGPLLGGRNDDGTEAGTASGTADRSPKQGHCEGDIVVTFGTSEDSKETLGTLMPLAKMAVLNPAILSSCPDPFVEQCKWSYAFPKGVVKGADVVGAEYAVMVYSLASENWGLMRAKVNEVVMDYSSSPDKDKLSPQQTSFPWSSGPAGVLAGGQTVQNVRCA